MQIKISKKAKNDLTNIWEYTFKKWSLQQADKYYDILVEGINTISREPNIGKNYEKIRNGYQGFQVKSHIIFYRVPDENNIEIIRVLHERMDIKNRLKG